MECHISILNEENPNYNFFLKKAIEQKQWKNAAFLENIGSWPKCFSNHAAAYLAVFMENKKIIGFLPMLEKKGNYFAPLSDFLFGEGICPIDENADITKFNLKEFYLENKQYSFCLQKDAPLPKYHIKKINTEYFFQKDKSFEEYISNLGTGWKKELRRRKNIWEKNNIICSTIKNFNEHMGDFFIMHRKRFGKSFYNSKEIITFLHRYAKKKQEDIFAFELKNKKYLGTIVWARMGKRINLFSMVYDDSQTKLNLGKALVYYSLKSLFSLPGQYEINFDAGNKDYKLHWTDKTREYTVCLPMDS